MNDLMEQELMAGSVLHVYADDILLYRTIHSTHDFLSLASLKSQHGHVQVSLVTPSTATSASLWFCLIDKLLPIQSLTIEDHPLEM